MSLTRASAARRRRPRPWLANDFWPKFRRRWRAAKPRPLHAGLAKGLLAHIPQHLTYHLLQHGHIPLRCHPH